VNRIVLIDLDLIWANIGIQLLFEMKFFLYGKL